MHVQLSYDVSRTLILTANLANIVNTCFGESNVPWKVRDACGYGPDLADVTGATAGPGGSSITGGVGNTFDPGNGIRPGMRYAYSPYWLQQPFGFSVDADVKL